jgi:TolB-like protein/DNA-binding winged helix-turn-helix (wHTH) protein/Flp pilus assembly protein TadD
MTMPETGLPGRRAARFGGFELDLRSGELSRQGFRVRLQDKPLRVLELLLERQGDVVTRDELRRVLWPEDTFVDFDGGLNTAVNKLRTALGDSADTPRFVETLGRRGYRFIAAVEPIADAAEAAAPPARRRPRRLMAWTGAALVAVVVVGGLWWHRQRAPAPLTVSSLAVLPLKSLSDRSEDDYFADGMTEALITQLAGIRSLRVISRQSVVRYKESARPLPEIARELGVEAIVEGSVMRSADRVRVSAQLVLGSADRHLWARSYEGDLADVLALQAQVAEAIAGEVRATLTGAERARLSRIRPVDPEAYDLYLRGLYFFNQRWQDDPVSTISRSVDYLERAVARDPQFALAHAALGEAYGPYAYWAPIAPDEARARRRRAATRALELDADLAQAHTALGSTLVNEWDWSGAEREFQRAIELSPNYAVARFWYSLLLLRRARFEEALQQTELGFANDPFDPTLASHNAAALANLGRPEEAIARLRRFLELEPASSGARRTLAGIYVRLDRYEDALEEFARLGSADGRARVRAFQGDTAGLRAILAAAHQAARRRYVSPVAFASMYAALGDEERAFVHLARAADTKAIGLVDVVSTARFTTAQASPTMAREFDVLRSDARFIELQRRLKLE